MGGNLSARSPLQVVKKDVVMTIILIIGILLLVAWLVGLGRRYTLGGLIHIALAAALILIFIWLLRDVFKAF